MIDDLAQKSIQAALNGNWDEAVELNSKILRDDPTNVDALNRMAKAYAEQGDIKKAKATSTKVLKIDPNNSIAKRCVDKWKELDGKNGSHSPSKLNPISFIEEPGKTKIIDLINLGSTPNIASLDCGDIVKIIAHPHRVSVVTTDDKYVGRFPDNIAFRYANLIRAGGSFEALVKSSDGKQVQVLVRELFSKNGL